MRLSVRAKLFAASFLVIITAGTASGIYLRGKVDDHVLMIGGVIAMAIAVAMSALASHLLSAELRQLVRSARSKTPDATGAARRGDEIGEIAGSLNQLSRELERALTHLAAERARFEAVLESMSEAVVALDQRSRIEFVNSRALSLLGLDDSPIGKTMLEVLRVPALQGATAAAHGGDHASAELDMPGTTRRVLVTASPQRSRHGCILVFRDVTEIRRLERVRRDFVSNVSHELRTPVSIVRANAETLLDAHDAGPERTRPLLEATVRHAERLSRIIDDLLVLSRLEAGKRQLTVEPAELAPVAQRAAELVVNATHTEPERVTVDIDGDATAVCDAVALEQVLVNLIDNAVKYSPADSDVRITAAADGDRIRIEVIDRGPGIAQHHRDRVFERFYRIDEGRSRAVGGTGLGLSIVKHLTEAMNGEVGVDSTATGSTFWVALPRQ